MTDVVPSDPQGNARKTPISYKSDSGYADNLDEPIWLQAQDLTHEHVQRILKWHNAVMEQERQKWVSDLAAADFGAKLTAAYPPSEAKDSTANPSIDQLLNTLVNQIEWSVQVPGAVDIDREKEAEAKTQFKAHLRTTILSALPVKFDNFNQGILSKEAQTGWNVAISEVVDTITKLLS